MPNEVEVADLFCGAGGTSNGVHDAALRHNLKLNLTAINHWPLAIATHKANHPEDRHLCESLDNVNPRKLFPKQKLNILVASPECQNHTDARGSAPVDDESRCTAWHVLRWAEALNIDSLLIENVPKFTHWGPLDKLGRKIKSRRGETFNAWRAALDSLGYTTDWRILNSANFGDPTARERFFLIARKGRRKIDWPLATHCDPLLHYDLLPWRQAREIIDWTLSGNSILNRERPLVKNTVKRIEAGLRKFGTGDVAQLVSLLHGKTKPQYEPFQIPSLSGKTECPAFLVKFYGTGGCKSIDLPLDTVTTRDRFGLVMVDCGKKKMDIRFRMLQNHEYARAMSFPAGYKFVADSRQDELKQIGNAVPRLIAGALCYSLLAEYADKFMEKAS